MYIYIYEDHSKTAKPRPDFRFAVHFTLLHGSYLHRNDGRNLN